MTAIYCAYKCTHTHYGSAMCWFRHCSYMKRLSMSHCDCLWCRPAENMQKAESMTQRAHANTTLWSFDRPI